MSNRLNRQWVRRDKRAEAYHRGIGAAYQGTVPVALGADMCFSKRMFPSAAAATTRAQQIVAEGGPAMRAYACPACGRFHLSSQPARESRESRELRGIR